MYKRHLNDLVSKLKGTEKRKKVNFQSLEVGNACDDMSDSRQNERILSYLISDSE
jgi:hypothetical protein